MNNIERHCDTCNDSFYETERNPSGGKKMVRVAALLQRRLQLPRLHA